MLPHSLSEIAIHGDERDPDMSVKLQSRAKSGVAGAQYDNVRVALVLMFHVAMTMQGTQL
ncbi:hypothetical protein [Streptomyces sp. NPDC094458]|uniref:hypothetical protein n=1 Tax=Streptomyces sp. NPDC094458 TaxID=3155208 RepID=UPI003329523F